MKNYAKLKKAYANDPAMLRTLESQEQADILRTISKKKVTIGELKGIETVRGEKGGDGKDGKDADEERIIKEVLKKIRQPEDGKTPTRAELLDIIRPLIPSVRDGKDADEERILKRVISLMPIPKNGVDGKNGSPDTPEQIAEKLNMLEGALEVTVLKGYENADEIIKKIKEQKLEMRDIKNMPLNMNDMRYHGGGITKISNSGTVVTTNGTSLNFTGTGLSSVTDLNGVVTISVSSGGSPVFGTPYNIPYFNATGNDLATNAPYFVYDESNYSVSIVTENFNDIGALQLEALAGNTLMRITGATGQITRYLLSNTAPTLGLAAEIGSWASDNVNFYIKSGVGNTDWGIPLLYSPITSRIVNPITTGGNISFLTQSGLFEAGDLDDIVDGIKLNVGFGLVNFGDTNGLVNGTSVTLDDTTGQIVFLYGNGVPAQTTVFTSTLIDTDTDIRADHYRGRTSAPTISAGAGAGTTPIVTVTGNDFKHSVSVRTGTSPTAGAVIATVTFDKAWTTTNNNPVFSAQDLNAGLSITEVYMVRTSATTYDIIDVGSGLKPSETYTWSVICGE